MSATTSLPATPATARRSLPAGWARVLLPSLPDCVFVALIAWLFMHGDSGWSTLLFDGDLGWHIRTGEHILDTGRVPHQDLYSFSRPGAPWFAWEWGTDVLYGLLHRLAGLKGIVLLAAVTIGMLASVLLRHMVWRGANPLAAAGLTFLAVGACSVHFHARPHLFTLLLLAVAMWLIDRDRRTPTRAVWLLVPLAALWTNLHGGFLILIACLGLTAVGSAVEALWRGDGPDRWRTSYRYGWLVVACAAATVLNPYGIGLHQHVAEYLRSDWIQQHIDEFQSPRFRSENVLQFELLLFLGLVSVAGSVRRREVVPALWTLFLAHQSLAAVRHIPLYVIVVTPLAATEVTAWWRLLNAGLRKSAASRILAQVGEDMVPAFQRASLWPAAFVLFLALVYDVGTWPRDFPAVHFPTALVARRAELLAQARLFTYDQWADYLIYKNYPRQRVFMDGRSDFYGPTLGDEYLAMMQGQTTWRRLLAKHGFQAVLCPVEWPLVSLLRHDADWQVIDEDRKAVLFTRKSATATAGLVPASYAFQKSPSPRLMEATSAAEF